MPPAVIAAGVGAAGAIGGAVIGGSSQRSATRAAVDSSEHTAAINNALARDIYGQNQQILSPYVSRGNMAGNAINSLLGLGTANSNAPATQAQGGLGTVGGISPSGTFGGFNSGVQSKLTGNMPHVDGGGGGWGTPVQMQQQMQQMPQQTMQAATGGAGSAFENFLNSAGARFQLDEGYKATNQGYAARGMLQSGAALKALQDRGQQTMLNNYFMPYMGLLSNQQGVGLSGASAVAGVGQNYVNNVSANNNAAGTAAANGALMNGAINSNMWSGIGNSLGSLASSFVPRG